MNRSYSFTITDPSQVGEARRLTAQLAKQNNLNETDAGKAGIVATELATNLVKHAKSGTILIRPLIQGEQRGLEILTLDHGPGITDIQKSLQDGFSTSGTPGNGLGSVKRLSSVFDLYSNPQGTILLSQIWQDAFVPTFIVGAISVPYPGEQVCGDAWSLFERTSGLALMVADGLGHGLHAAEASALAVRLFEEYQSEAPGILLQRLHQGMRATRGAAVMSIAASSNTAQVICSGIGNIAGTILQGTASRSMVSLNGIVGHQVAKVQEFIYPWPKDALMILHSDGIQTRWKFDAYPGILLRHPSMIAAVLFRDFRRDRDDATVVVIRENNHRL